MHVKAADALSARSSRCCSGGERLFDEPLGAPKGYRVRERASAGTGAHVWMERTPC